MAAADISMIRITSLIRGYSNIHTDGETLLPSISHIILNILNVVITKRDRIKAWKAIFASEITVFHWLVQSPIGRGLIWKSETPKSPTPLQPVGLWWPSRTLDSVLPSLKIPFSLPSLQWADENFPICEGHGKRCVLRVTLKQGPNNGRKFFTCSLEKNKKPCQFFMWADQYSDINVR